MGHCSRTGGTRAGCIECAAGAPRAAWRRPEKFKVAGVFCVVFSKTSSRGPSTYLELGGARKGDRECRKESLPAYHRVDRLSNVSPSPQGKKTPSLCSAPHRCGGSAPDGRGWRGSQAAADGQRLGQPDQEHKKYGGWQSTRHRRSRPA